MTGTDIIVYGSSSRTLACWTCCGMHWLLKQWSKCVFCIQMSLVKVTAKVLTWPWPLLISVRSVLLYSSILLSAQLVSNWCVIKDFTLVNHYDVMLVCLLYYLILRSTWFQLVRWGSYGEETSATSVHVCSECVREPCQGRVSIRCRSRCRLVQSAICHVLSNSLSDLTP